MGLGFRDCSGKPGHVSSLAQLLEQLLVHRASSEFRIQGLKLHDCSLLVSAQTSEIAIVLVIVIVIVTQYADKDMDRGVSQCSIWGCILFDFLSISYEGSSQSWSPLGGHRDKI